MKTSNQTLAKSILETVIAECPNVTPRYLMEETIYRARTSYNVELTRAEAGQALTDYTADLNIFAKAGIGIVAVVIAVAVAACLVGENVWRGVKGLLAVAPDGNPRNRFEN